MGKDNLKTPLFWAKSVYLLLFILFLVEGILSANHFRYGTMSWEPTGNAREIRLNMQNGWTADHPDFSSTVVDTIKQNYITIDWGDDNTTLVDIKILTRDTVTNDTISVMGSDASSSWVAGITHTYVSDGDYVVYWGSSARESVNNSNGYAWRNETKVNIGGTYSSNTSPVSAAPSIVQVQDNQSFVYQVAATDADADTLNYRWGTVSEFYVSGSTTTYVEPTGMTLSSSGLVRWDVTDSVLSTAVADRWGAVMMVEDLDTSGTVKSYVPLDFVFKISESVNAAPQFSAFPTGTKTVSVGKTKLLTIKSIDDSGVAPTISVLNPPLSDVTLWSSSTSVSSGESTLAITFAPDTTLIGKTYAVNIRSTDNASMTKDQTLSIKVSSVANNDPIAPILLSPANASTVTIPVNFSWNKATDVDSDAITYQMYFCTDMSFTGCTGTSLTSIDFNPFENIPSTDSLLSTTRMLHAATSGLPIRKSSNILPWMILLGVMGLISGIISLKVTNNIQRKILYFLLLISLLAMVSCNSFEEENAPDAIPPDLVRFSTSDVTASTTYYWKVVAEDSKGGSADSETWSFIVN